MATLPQAGTVASVETLTEGIARVRVAWEPGAGFPFRAGQWTLLQAQDGDRILKRCFSIASPPQDRSGLTYVVERTGTGGLSDWLHAAKGGERVEVRGPHGKFVVEEPVSAPVLFLPFDTGISPVWSILQDLSARKVAGRVHLGYGWGREQGNPPLHAVLGTMASGWPALTYEMLPAEGAIARIRKTLKALPEARVYLAGRVRYLDPARQELLDAGVDASRILEEPYDRPKG
jgi:benzoate/toluate 1,2-dioxygenase reductase subunit